MHNSSIFKMAANGCYSAYVLDDITGSVNLRFSSHFDRICSEGILSNRIKNNYMMAYFPICLTINHRNIYLILINNCASKTDRPVY